MVFDFSLAISCTCVLCTVAGPGPSPGHGRDPRAADWCANPWADHRHPSEIDIPAIMFLDYLCSVSSSFETDFYLICKYMSHIFLHVSSAFCCTLKLIICPGRVPNCYLHICVSITLSHCIGKQCMVYCKLFINMTC